MKFNIGQKVFCRNSHYWGIELEIFGYDSSRNSYSLWDRGGRVSVEIDEMFLYESRD